MFLRYLKICPKIDSCTFQKRQLFCYGSNGYHSKVNCSVGLQNGSLVEFVAKYPVGFVARSPIGFLEKCPGVLLSKVPFWIYDNDTLWICDQEPHRFCRKLSHWTCNIWSRWLCYRTLYLFLTKYPHFYVRNYFFRIFMSKNNI